MTNVVQMSQAIKVSPVVKLCQTLDAAYTSKLTLYEQTVLIFLARNTYGKQTDSIKITAVAIGDQCNIDSSNTRKAISSLVNRNIIFKEGKTLSINLEFHAWLDKPKQVDLTRNENGSNIPVREINGLIQPEKRVDLTPNSSSSNIKTISMSQNDIGRDEKNSKNPPKKKPQFSEDDKKAAEFIFSKLHAYNPEMKKPNLDTWANQVRLMRERDGRAHKRICEVFVFAHNDPFWKQNILSPKKLREKFDQLTVKMKNGSTTNGTNQSGRFTERLTAAQKQERDRKRIEAMQREEARAASAKNDFEGSELPPYLV